MFTNKKELQNAYEQAKSELEAQRALYNRVNPHKNKNISLNITKFTSSPTFFFLPFSFFFFFFKKFFCLVYV